MGTRPHFQTVYVCLLYMYILLYMQDQLKDSASHLHSSQHKVEDMVDECEDYINYLRNTAVEVHVHLCTCDCLGCTVLFCLVCLFVCLTLLASYFLPSHLSLKHVHVHVNFHVYI